MKPPNLGNKLCKFITPALHESFGMWDKGGLADKMSYMTRSPFEMVNCSIGYFTGQWSIGKKLSNGSYDGMLGVMVNEKANATALAYVLGSTDDEPVIVGPVWTSTEMSILSAKHVSKGKKLGPEGWIMNFKPVIYEYILISILIFIFFYVTITHVYEKFNREEKVMKTIMNGIKINYKTISGKIRKRKIRMKKLMKCFIITLWKCLTSFFRTEYFAAPSLGQKFLVTFFCFAIFFLIDGLFLNLTSTDMIAVQPVPIIDNLDDLLYSDHFKHMNVGIPGGLWQESILEGSPKDSAEGELWKRVKHKIGIQVDDTEKIASIMNRAMDKLFRYEAVLVVDTTIINAGKSIICQLHGLEKGSNTHVSRGDTFAEKLITFSISKSSDKMLIKWINYRQSLLLQSGLTKKWINLIAYNFKVDPSVTFELITDCLEPERGRQKIPDPIKIDFIMSTITLMMILLINSGLILILEIMLCRLGQNVT